LLSEGRVNVGAGALLRHYPDHDLTVAILGVGERAIWEPVAVFDGAVSPPEPEPADWRFPNGPRQSSSTCGGAAM
jgi:hypothetical protein